VGAVGGYLVDVEDQSGQDRGYYGGLHFAGCSGRGDSEKTPSGCHIVGGSCYIYLRPGEIVQIAGTALR